MAQSGNPLEALQDILDHGINNIQKFQGNTQVEQKAKGMLRGHNVTWQPAAQSLIEDGSEEATFFAGDRLANKLKKYQQRQKAIQLKRLMNEHAARVTNEVPDIGDPKKLKEFLTQLLEKGSNYKAVKEHTQHTFKERTHQYAGLSFAQGVLKQHGSSPGLAKHVDQAMEDLMSGHGTEIRAGMIISKVASDYERQGLGKTSDLRSLYHEIILGHEDLEKTYKTIGKRIQEIDLPKALTFLISAVGNDLGAISSSISKVLLRRCLDDLSRLYLLRGLYKDIQNILVELQNKFSRGRNVSPEAFFVKVMDMFCKSWGCSQIIDQMHRMLRIDDLKPSIFFLSSLGDLIRLAPMKLFKRTRDRKTLRDLIQGKLDEVIALEEEEEEGQNNLL